MRSADVGRFLVLLGCLAWITAGVPRIAAIVELGAGPRDVVWVVLFVAFGMCAGLALAARSARAALFLTVAQSAIAIAILAVGMDHFEGALLALVGAQARLVVPTRVAFAWIALQAAPLFVAVLPSHELLGAAKATLEYAAFASFATVVFDLRQKERERRAELGQVNAELLGTRALLAETARFAEQRRIGRDLHDVVGHHLVALSMHIDRARAEPAGDGLDRARETLDAVQGDARALLSGFDAGIDLVAALRVLSAATPSMRVRIETPSVVAIGPDAAWAIFRCVQEGLTNAWKHGRARQVVVTIRADGENCTVRIENDGARLGAPPAPGRGLQGMRDRLRELGGDLVVEAGETFVLVVTLPMAARRTA